jgi:hypothetical protein
MGRSRPPALLAAETPKILVHYTEIGGIFVPLGEFSMPSIDIMVRDGWSGRG